MKLKSIVLLHTLYMLVAMSLLSGCTSGGNEVYISSCFPFPESWCTEQPNSNDTTPPSTPANLLASAVTPAAISLSWGASTDDTGLLGYKIYRDGAYVGYTDAATISYLDNGLIPLTKYCYSVVAVDLSQNSSNFSAESCATTPDDTAAPSTPGNLVATYVLTTQGEHTFDLAWDASIDNGAVKGYNVYRDGVLIGTSSQNSYTDNTGLTSLKLYCYTVSAFDTAGNSSQQSSTACESTGWRHLAVTSDPYSSDVASSIDIDNNDYIHISYVNNHSTITPTVVYYGDTKYATNQTGQWTQQTIASHVTDYLTSSNTVVHVDTNSVSHVTSSYDYPVHTLFHSDNSIGVWTSESLANSNYLYGHDMAVDANGHMHIVYNNGGELTYVTNQSGSWMTSVIETVSTVNYNTMSPAVAVDTANHVHVSYYDYDNSALKYATDKFGVWASAIIDNTADVGRNSSITVGRDGYVRISYYDITNHALKYVTDISGSWQPVSIDATTDSGMFSAIVTDSSNKTHISYVNTSDHTLHYASDKSGSWVTGIVDDADYVNYKTAIAVDSHDKLHISYSCTISNGMNLCYANNM